MREAIGKFLAFAAVASLMLPGFVPDTSAATINGNTTVNLKANISFERAIAIGKESDVTFGDVQTRPNDKVMLDTAGNMRLEGKGEVLAP